MSHHKITEEKRIITIKWLVNSSITWQFTNASGECYPKYTHNVQWTEVVELGSYHITKILVSYWGQFGTIWGLIFYTGDTEMARIGTHRGNWKKTVIELEDSEILCGFSSSGNTQNALEYCQFITARIE